MRLGLTRPNLCPDVTTHSIPPSAPLHFAPLTLSLVFTPTLPPVAYRSLRSLRLPTPPLHPIPPIAHYIPSGRHAIPRCGWDRRPGRGREWNEGWVGSTGPLGPRLTLRSSLHPNAPSGPRAYTPSAQTTPTLGPIGPVCTPAHTPSTRLRSLQSYSLRSYRSPTRPIPTHSLPTGSLTLPLWSGTVRE